MTEGRVIKILSDRFAVYSAGETVFVKSRKKLKRDILPLVGDSVKLENAGGEYVLSGIAERKNRIIRPPIANVDLIIITLAPLPAAEFLTVDKMIISAHQAGIDTVVCVNKTDIMPEGFFENVKSQYDGVADYVVSVCAAKHDTEELKKLLAGKICCFAGQSAVGKTSLINEICGVNREVGEISEKTLRGKNTTTGVELIDIGDNTFIADTPGFGSVDLFDIEPSDLPLYYGEYVKLSGGCKYNMCSHTTEPECAVKAAVLRGELDSKRYERYTELIEELKNKKLHRKSWRNAYEKK